MNVEPLLDTVSLLPSNLRDKSISHELRAALLEARDYIEFFNWVEIIEKQYLGFGIEGIIYLFLFKIKSPRDDVDPWVWVVVGDVPPAYLTCEESKTPFEALDSYIGAMEEWVLAAKNGKSVAELIPVNISANPENALLMEKRLKFLDEKIITLLKS